MLKSLCEALGVDFTPAMLSWPAGRRPTDGIWAKHWYDAVESSTGFRPYRPKTVELPDRLQGLYDECLPYYGKLHAARITTGSPPADG